MAITAGGVGVGDGGYVDLSRSLLCTLTSHHSCRCKWCWCLCVGVCVCVWGGGGVDMYRYVMLVWKGVLATVIMAIAAGGVGGLWY